jgi:hypothetical protein
MIKLILSFSSTHPVRLLHGIMIPLCKDWTGLPYLPLY